MLNVIGVLVQYLNVGHKVSIQKEEEKSGARNDKIKFK
jgi:hypothetical protein